LVSRSVSYLTNFTGKNAGGRILSEIELYKIQISVNVRDFV